MEIPGWLEHKLKNEDLLDIEKTVKNVETTTEAEIVPVVVKISIDKSLNNRLALFAMLGIILSAVSAVGAFMTKEMFYFFGFIVLYNVFRRTISFSNKKKKEAVEKRAAKEFYENSLDKTAKGTGVLVFLSDHEQKIVILCDSKLTDLNSNTWEKIIKDFPKEVARVKLGPALNKVIKDIGKVLSESCPASKGNVNELPNKLIIKE